MQTVASLLIIKYGGNKGPKVFELFFFFVVVYYCCVMFDELYGDTFEPKMKQIKADIEK